MAKSDARFEYRANLNRESFNLGEPFGLTCAPGQLLPVFEDIATPKDTYYIRHDLEYLRTLPLTAPAMVDVKVHFESFFVPFQMIYQPIEQVLFSLLNPQSDFYSTVGFVNNDFPTCNYSAIKTLMTGTNKHTKERFDFIRLCDLFGMNPYSYIEDGSNPSIFSWNPSVFPWQFLAYQTIYQYFYRLDDKEGFDNRCCNWDSAYSSTSPITPTIPLFELRQRPWDFDYFTSMYRSPIVSDASMQEVLFNKNYSDLTAVDTRKIDNYGAAQSVNSDTRAFSSSVSSGFDPSNVQTAFGTSAIRQMFANEKLAMITGRARKNYDSQVLAHFGVDVPHDPKHDISFIGRDTYELKVGEVTSLSDTAGAGLGSLAGKGWAAGQSHEAHKFVAPCHGVVMTIMSIEPRKRYYGGYDRINALTNAFDIPTPEFDRLGNMPMYRYEAGENAGSGAVTPVDVIGWKERYYYNKRRHPKVTLAFMNNRPSVGYNDKSAYMLTSAPFGAYTSTNNNTARPDLGSRFYIDLNCMDGMMLQPYIRTWQNGLSGEETTENWNATPWLAYARDPFIVDLNMKIKKVSWMSKDGEPVYNF